VSCCRTLFTLVAALTAVGIVGSSVATAQRAGLILHEERAFPGYSLLAPISSTTTHLIDMDGEVVHTWESDATAGNAVYLLESGHIRRTEAVAPPGERKFERGGAGGRVREIAWDGTIVWGFTYSNSEHRPHHDVTVLPNGNVLMIAWEIKSSEEAVAAGRNPSLLQDGGLWLDHIIEVNKTNNDIVWEWHVWDHLIQDFDPTKANYGVVADHPELIDVNFIPTRGPAGDAADWNHTKGIAYNESLDQIILSVHEFDEIWIIDHSTTTEEAAGHTGGHYGRGGDFLYRWGNPQVYRAGTPRDQILFGQHDAHWVKDGYPDGNHILAFNNGMGRPGKEFSTVIEIVPPLSEEGSYVCPPGLPFPPRSPVWGYRATPPIDFYSRSISGAQRLPNGNTLICSGANGRLFEVTPDGEIVWEYVNPFITQTRDGPHNEVFKVRRYTPDYPGLAEFEIPGPSTD